MLATLGGQDLPAYYSAGPADTMIEVLANKGVWAAASDNRNLAQSTLKTLRRRAKLDDDTRAEADLIEGWLAARASRWNEVVRLLGVMAGSDHLPGSTGMEFQRVAMRWLVADAYEHLGQPDSAAAVFESMVRDRHDNGSWDHGICYSFVHRRLVLLDARLGRVAEARRHWETLSRTCTHPDTDLARGLEDARAALASAEAVAGSRKR